jgi:hypothetical protein
MLFIENIINKPGLLQRIIGVKPRLLNLLVEKVAPLWEKAEEERLSKRSRKRNIGGGNKYKLGTVRNLVLIVLFYYKQYPTQELLGVLCNLHQSNISRLLKKMLPLIEEAADPELKTFLAKVKEDVSRERITNLGDLIKKYPELKDISQDVTEGNVFRSKKYEIQKEFYSGKAKQHTIKTQMAVANSHRIVDISESYPGSVHDKKIMDSEKTIEKIPEQIPQRFDLGYQGVKNEYPSHNIILPIKKPKGGELSPLEKEFNKANSSLRVIVENAFARLKKFRILSHPFRQPLEAYNQTFRNVGALLNFKLAHASLATNPQ